MQWFLYFWYLHKITGTYMRSVFFNKSLSRANNSAIHLAINILPRLSLFLPLYCLIRSTLCITDYIICVVAYQPRHTKNLVSPVWLWIRLLDFAIGTKKTLSFSNNRMNRSVYCDDNITVTTGNPNNGIHRSLGQTSTSVSISLQSLHSTLSRLETIVLL